MKPLLPPPLAALALFAGLMLPGSRPEAAAQDVKEQPLQAPHGVTHPAGKCRTLLGERPGGDECKR